MNVEEPLRRNRPFQRLVSAALASEFSSAMASVVLPLLVLGAGETAGIAGVVTFITTAAAIVSQVFSGAIADRMSGVRAFRLASLAQAACWLVLATLVALDPRPAWFVVAAIAAVAMGFSSLCYPSQESLVKRLVPEAQFGQAAAVSQGREAAAGLLGGPAGGALFGVKAGLAILVQAALHAVAALIIPSPEPVEHHDLEPGAAKGGFFGDVADGFRVLAGNRHLRSITIVASLMNLPMASLPFVLIVYYQSRGFSDALIGVMSSCIGVGVVAGALLAGNLTSHYSVGSLGVAALGSYVVAVGAITAVYSHFGWACACLVISGFMLPAFNSAIGAYTIAVTPVERVGRVTAAIAVPGMMLMPLGPLLAGALFDTVGSSATLLVVWILTLTPFLIAAFDPSFRKTPRLAELSDSPEADRS